MPASSQDVRAKTTPVASTDSAEYFHDGFRGLIENSLQGILIHRDWQPIFANDALARIFGCPEANAILELDNVRELYAEHERDRLKMFNEKRLAGGEVRRSMNLKRFERTAHPSGFRRQYGSSIGTESGRATQHWFIDVKERKRAGQHVARLSSYGVLTGLANRAMFKSELRQSTVQVGRTGGFGALILLDLDNFKDVNDSHGHPAGDKLLKRVAQRLVSRIHETDFVACLGGDEFAIVANNLKNANDAAAIAEMVKDALANSIELDGTDTFTKASFGITMFPEDSSDPNVLLKTADMALYHAKNAGSGRFAFYNANLNAQTIRQKDHERAFRMAVTDDIGLHLKYQPKVDIVQGEVVNVEALLRWSHETYGEISPVEFIPIAETSGLIVEIGDWVLRKSCEQILKWQISGLPPVPITVNLLAVQLKRTDLVEAVGKLMGEFQIEPSWLELEITESTIMDYVEETVAALHGLHDIGVSLAI
ncbi:MAG: diguanylate cyclase, partial [Pseudomonadota bacterium]|nr:diguanylate cyclase [Pseudomonadota bacterium]